MAMSGRIVGLALLVCAVVAAGGIYYLQVYGYYNPVPSQPGRDVMLTPLNGNAPETIDYREFQAINAPSSPIRYRACFRTVRTLDDLATHYIQVPSASPRNAPFWFSCFDASKIADGISSERYRVFLGEKNTVFGVDRLVAIDGIGRGYAWHELNNCGRKAYDGTVTGEACPDHP